MKQLKLIIAVLVLLASTFQSCDDSSEIDVTAPAIEIDLPTNHQYAEADKPIQFKATFTDDIELATYNIQIHDNFDGHAHGRLMNDPDLVKWSYNQSFLIPGGHQTYNVDDSEEIIVPDNAMAGPYHFIISAIDKAGNATTHQDGSTQELEIFITNDSQPVINVTNAPDEELDIEVGVIFMAEGDITDPTTGQYAGIHTVEVILGEEHEDEHDHGGRIAEEDLIDRDFEESELEHFLVDGKISLDLMFQEIGFKLSQEQADDLASEGVDHLFLIIRAFDEQGNLTIKEVEVQIE